MSGAGSLPASGHRASLRDLPWGDMTRHVLGHPRDGLVLARAGWRLRRRWWWRRPPFLPLPGRGYLDFRLATAYGDEARPTAHEMVEAARWSLRHGTRG